MISGRRMTFRICRIRTSKLGLPVNMSNQSPNSKGKASPGRRTQGWCPSWRISRRPRYHPASCTCVRLRIHLDQGAPCASTSISTRTRPWHCIKEFVFAGVSGFQRIHSSSTIRQNTMENGSEMLMQIAMGNFVIEKSSNQIVCAALK